MELLLEKHFDILLHPRYLCYSASRLEFSGFEGFEPILLLPGCGEFVNVMYMMCKLSENLEAGSTDVASKFAYKFSKYPGRDGIGGTNFLKKNAHRCPNVGVTGVGSVKRPGKRTFISIHGNTQNACMHSKN